MKKIIFKSTILLFIAAFFTGCSASHYGYMANSASLSAANFSYQKQNVKGEASVTYILGMGGLKRKTLVDDAKQKMLSENPLSSNQTFANLTVNFKASRYLGIYRTVKCTVTADIVEFK